MPLHTSEYRIRALIDACVCAREVLEDGMPEVGLDVAVLPEMSSCPTVRSTTGIESWTLALPARIYHPESLKTREDFPSFPFDS